MIPSSTPSVIQQERLREEIQRVVDNSIYTIAARAVGFTFGPVELIGSGDGRGFMVRMRFKCLCGRDEVFQYITPTVASDVDLLVHYDRLPDVARMLYKDGEGSFSAEHLISDGYPEEFAHKTARTYRVIIEALRRDRENYPRVAYPARVACPVWHDDPQRVEDGPHAAEPYSDGGWAERLRVAVPRR